MYTETHPTGEKEIERRKVLAIDPALAEALERPAEEHFVCSEKERVVQYWESAATSGMTEAWVTRRQWREALNGNHMEG